LNNAQSMLNHTCLILEIQRTNLKPTQAKANCMPGLYSADYQVFIVIFTYPYSQYVKKMDTSLPSAYKDKN